MLEFHFPDDNSDYGSLFFLQIPSIDAWSNANVLFRPVRFLSEGCLNQQIRSYVRIYTTFFGRGQIIINTVSINATEYKPIAESDFYYYETTMTEHEYRISAVDLNINFSVSSYLCLLN